MKLEGEGKLLRIFIGEADKLDHKPLYEALVYKAKEMGMAGATVIRGVLSYGPSSRIHTAKILQLSEDLPFVVELVDTEEKIDTFIGIASAMIEQSRCGAMMTEERTHIIRYFPEK